MPASYEQGFNALAKASTRYLATGASITACNVDLSQYATNLSIFSTTNLFQAAATRFDFSHPRTIGFRVEMSTTTTGTLFRHGAGSPTRLDIAVAGTLRAVVNNAAVGTLVLADAGFNTTARDGVVAWTSRANPDTTGAGNAVESTLHVWRPAATPGYTKSVFTHAVSTAKSQTAIFGASDNLGASVWSGTITGIWFENREQSMPEIEADWVTTYTPPTSTFSVEGQGIPPQADTLDLANHYHGPAAVWAADATARMQQRTLSAFCNDVCRVRPAWQTTTLNGPFVRRASGNLPWRMPLGHLRVYAVPDTCNALAVKAHVRSWTTSGAAVPVGLRVYSMSRPPGAIGLGLGGGGDPFVQFFDEVIVTRDDDASGGAWTEFDPIPIARGKSGMRRGKTYVAIALAIDPYAASANDANARVQINAVHVVPGFLDPAGGGQFGLELA